ncbi:hypothetical protein CFC21_037981 [Triticum aestivum]|uniref:F-box domain-containing protein n=2 Tax=Triticum aestivum TaxID=4565 RepID=A0A9R1FB80_WHEAT|nr:hypothetical protein CFC21_037981 [Triticum aestivum]
MAEAAPLSPHRSLPEEISIWEILVRLPPKALLRCRAVCRTWRGATSTHDFLLAHHARQPALPLFYASNFKCDGDRVKSLDIIPFDHRVGIAAADRLQSVARIDLSYPGLEISCDGLLVFSVGENRNLSVYNPATRQYAPLPQIAGFMLLGMYLHSPTGEYRLLLYLSDANLGHNGSYVFSVGSDQPPRYKGYPNAFELMFTRPILFRGSLHWQILKSAGNMLKVFNTTVESFRQMRAPLLPYPAHLFEMDGMLSMFSFDEATNTTIDIWMSQDYDNEVWALKYRVKLPVADLTVRFGKFVEYWNFMVTSRDGDVSMLVKFGEWLLQFDINGKFSASFHFRGLFPAEHCLKQTLVQHTFFPMLQGYVVKNSPFIGCDSCPVRQRF